MFSINMSFVTDWNVSYNNIAMVYINITTECGWKYCCTLALRNMSVNFGTEFKTTFPFYTIYKLKQNLLRNDLIHISTLIKGSAGAVTGRGKSLAK